MSYRDQMVKQNGFWPAPETTRFQDDKIEEMDREQNRYAVEINVCNQLPRSGGNNE